MGAARLTPGVMTPAQFQWPMVRSTTRPSSTSRNRAATAIRIRSSRVSSESRSTVLTFSGRASALPYVVCRLRSPLALVALMLLGAALSVEGQGTPADAPTRDTVRIRGLDTMRVTGRIDDLVGIAGTASEGHVGAADLRLRPITREGELLETVPGVIVTQHSGEGKANQYFVRGFNLDHGTDFQSRLEGMPLNMPTHGHGQGYTDLNFLIPELLDHLDYKLGVYHADVGDFGSAGAAEFTLKSRLDQAFASVGYGANGLARLAAGRSDAVGAGTLLLAAEGKEYDGPWDLAERVRKLSGVARYA
jgi:hypothetical protein